MIRRTVLEWGSLAYDGDPEDPARIPAWAADRIAAVAKASPIGGGDGARIVQHGRRAIRAQGVVGIVAAEGCTLEILPKIDGLDDDPATLRRNLVHMLATAIDLDIAVGDLAALDWQRDDLLEILIRLFCDRLFAAVHAGLPRRYVACADDLPALRGRLDVVRQFTAFAAAPVKLACRYDALSADIALNRIMKAAVTKLGRLSRAPETQRRLRELALAFADVTDVPAKALRWDEVVLDRTNARWRDLVSLARLLLGDRFQTTSAGAGQGFSLLFEMNRLFEDYVGRMLRRALAGRRLEVQLQGGGLHCLTELSLETGEPGTGRFVTRPDVIVRRAGEPVAIIDTKWKRLGRAMDDPKQGVSQADVYQMMAYGRLYGCPALVLLYPHHRGLGCPAGLIRRHRVTGCADELGIATVDLASLVGVPAALSALLNPIGGRELAA